MVTPGAVWLVMVAIVMLDDGQIPPMWRGGACLMAGVCLNPEISPDTMGVPEKPGGGLVPIREGHVPVRLGSPRREVPIGSGRAGGLWEMAVGKPTWVSAASTSTSVWVSPWKPADG